MIYKLCSKCNRNLRSDKFHKDRSRKDGMQAYCIECMRDYGKKIWADDNRRKSQADSAKVRRKRNYDYAKNYLADHPCVDCGNDEVMVLEFDHVRGEKVGAVSLLCARGRTLESIQEEIDKCEVRCCNCHRRVTVQRLRGEWIDSAQV